MKSQNPSRCTDFFYFLFYQTIRHSKKERKRNMTPLFLLLYEEHQEHKTGKCEEKRKRKKMRNRKLLRKTQATQIMKDRTRSSDTK